MHTPDPSAPALRRGPAIAVVLAALAVVALFAARAYRIATTDSITSDESTHLVHCLHYWMTGDDLAMWELGAPRLPHALNAWPSYRALRSAGMLPTAADEAALNRLVLSGVGRVLVPARCVGIAWGVALLLTVFWGVGRTLGPWPALAATAVLSLAPEVVAHAAIAGSDMPFTAAATLAIVLLARFAERPSAGRWLAAALAVGLSWAMRHTGLLLLPAAGVVHLVASWRRLRPASLAAKAECLSGSVLAGAGLTIVAAAVLWAGDGFETVSLRDVSRRATTLSIPPRLGPIATDQMHVPTSALSVLKQVRHQNQGHQAYFCGEVRERGWPQYFPVAFALKTPVGLLILLALAAARVRPRAALEWVALGFLALLWVMLLRNKVNIGVRYALLTYPLAMPLVARMFTPTALRDRVWTPVVVASVAWLAFASLACGTRCLSYFNEIGGGPGRGWLYLADSNIDWGQDFGALAAEVRRLGLEEITLDVSSERRLDLPGVLAVANPSRAFQVPAVTPPDRRLYDSEGGYIPVFTRYMAVSVSRLMGLYSQNDVSWLRTRKVVARVGDSIFLFDLDTPADRPFGP